MGDTMNLRKKFIYVICVCVALTSFSGCSFFVRDNEDAVLVATENEDGTESVFEAVTEAEIETENETETTTESSEKNNEQTSDTTKQDNVSAKPVNKNYTYTIYEDPFHIPHYSVYKSSANVYDVPSASGNVIDTFGYKHMMFVVGKCNETGWYKIVYDDQICAPSNYRNHEMTYYDYTSTKPAIRPDQTQFTIFSRQAKNVKTGYINPKDVMMPEAWEDEMCNLWNGVRYYERYSMTPESLEFFKKLCYVPRRTFVEHENVVAVLFETGDIPFMEEKELFDSYALEHGYLYVGGSGYWIDGRAQPPAYYTGKEFLRFDEQYVIVGKNWSSAKINWDYIEKEYGYTKDILYDFYRYIESDYFDKSIGIWNEEEHSIRYNGYELMQVYQIIEQYKTQKLPPWDY